ncbi:MAG: pirin family protein [Akkermansiaceae bacterium]|jgi:quercetin 2,3-dioxygenase|nr:pirin family protein [Akkermansiaceae bacterium]MDP4780779.1 pirin family protein [Akkermansiaceae bacterium]MDP4845725.1 pirin family protein [Akkermansiaceae bacterium]MDP4995513.1 pirin family protein [Akkermansiaceae bacterium]
MKTSTSRFTVRKSAERGHANHGWLDTYHTFSFANYYDPAHMGFRSLRVINQDQVAPGAGFPTHPHRDMEIFSYVLSGAIAHKDSMGNGRELLPGQIQLMSAGTGVTHSESNPSKTDPLHLLQIWIQPEAQGLKPSYTEWHPTEQTENAAKVLVISHDGRENSATIHQDADVYRLRLKAGETISHELRDGRGLWLQLITGSLTVGETNLEAGDALSTEGAGRFELTANEEVEALLFDLG